MTKIDRPELKKLVKVLIQEGWLDFLKPKKRQTWSDWYKENLYTDVEKWIQDKLDNNNGYIGECLYLYGFPLRRGEFVPVGQEEAAMENWNNAKVEEKTQSIRAYKQFASGDYSNRWLKPKIKNKAGWLGGVQK